MTTEELQRLVELYDAGQAYDGPKETLECQRAKLARELIAARRVVEAVTHERNMPCQDMNLQILASQAVDHALSAYEEAKG